MTRKRAPIVRLGIAAALTATFLAGCAGDDEPKDVATTPTKASSEPSVSITSPKSGATVAGNVVTLDLEISGIDIVKADGDRSGKTGHIHAFIDRVPVAVGEDINKEPGIVHSVDNPLVLTGLTKGKHEITVVLGDGSHVRIGDNAEDSVTVDVTGPSVDATAPATVSVGAPVRIDFKVDGVQVVKADGDTSGKTGHFHVFVDKPLPKAGEVIPKPEDGSIIHTTEAFVEIPNLAAGEHVFYVVVGDGTHAALNPLVADKVTVTVA